MKPRKPAAIKACFPETPLKMAAYFPQGFFFLRWLLANIPCLLAPVVPASGPVVLDLRKAATQFHTV